MGVKEKKKERLREKKHTEAEDTEVFISAQEEEASSPIQENSQAPEVVIRRGSTTEASSENEAISRDMTAEAAYSETSALIPTWGSPEDSEWMYGVPPREEDRLLWAEEWSDYLLQWAEHNQVHVLSIADFISEPPFRDLRNKVDSFKMIAQVLITKEVAEWSDKKKRQLRIYWKPLEDWADLIYEWSLRTGKLRLDVKSIVIQESRESFAKLPESDLYNVMGLMVEKGFAEWIDKKKGAVLVST